LREKPPVLLLHEAGSRGQAWPVEIRRLAGYRVFTLDLPGHGRSPGAGHQSIAAYAGSLTAFLSALGVYQAAFLGHGMGGAIALALALDHPERTVAVGLLATAARFDLPRRLLEDSAFASTLPRAWEGIVQRCFGSAQDPREAETLSRHLLETRLGVLHGDLLACSQFDAHDRLDQAACPALVLGGSEDRLTPPAATHSLAARLPDSQLRLVYGAGHMLMVEQSQAVARALAAWLEAVPFQRGKG